MRAMEILDNGFKKNSRITSAIEYQNRLPRDHVKSFSLGVLLVCALFSNLFHHLFSYLY